MGEIIPVDFNNGRIIEGDKRNNDPIEEARIERKAGEEAGISARLANFIFLGNSERLMRLPATPSSLFQSREIVKEYDTEDLIGWLEKTEENEWRRRPAFFQAIFSELSSRLEQI